MSILFPNSRAPKTQQYDKAWADLVAADQFDRAHAKCWLTYRAVDGEITLDDWLKHVAMCNITGTGTRWRVSQSTAEFFLWTLHGNKENADEAAQVVFDADLLQWPDGLSHYCRLKSIIALQSYVSGNVDCCCDIIRNTIAFWKQIMCGFDFTKNANRFLEIRHDLHAINLMIWIGGHVGVLKTNTALNQWIPTSLTTQRDTPWWRCVEKVMRGEIGKWLPRLIQFDTRPDIKTRNDLAKQLFHGFGVELGVAAGKFTEQILTLGGVVKLHGIDKWNDHHNVAEWFQAMDRVKAFPTACQLLRANFSEVVSQFEDGSLNFVYVDGYAHTGQDDGKTLREWWPKIAVGGIMAGHDYSARWQKTMDAVDAFVIEHGLQLHLTTEDDPASWWVTK